MKKYVVLGVLVVCSGLAAAGIVFDNSVNGTSQDWDFYDASFPGSPISPDAGSQNPNGAATAFLDYTATTGGYRSWSGARRGVVFTVENLGISIEIPNYDNDNPYKEVYVEIVYLGEINGASVTWQGVTGMETETQFTDSDEVVLADGWKKYSALWTIQPNPTDETIQYSLVPVPGSQTEAQLDYILVQTTCIPEPATLLLFGLGGLVFRKKRQG